MKLVIFDCDGTLVDSQHMIVAAMDAAFRSEGLASPAREDVLAVVGLSLPAAVSRLLPIDAGGDLPGRLSEAYKAAFAESRRRADHGEPLYPGVRETIEHLAGLDGVLMGVATGKSQRGVRAVLEREGLTRHFTTIQTADTHPSKPHPSMILSAMAEAGAEAADTLMVGDTTYDVAMALEAGVGAVAVGWGYHPRAELLAAGAHVLIDESQELAAALDKLLNAPEIVT